MSGPYVAQDDDGGWYADVGGVMLGPDPARTREQALEWAFERMIKLADDYDSIIVRACPVRCGREVVVRGREG
jgi:hypothetical protein